MSSLSRKFLVWVISLAAVVVIYALVNQLSQTPRIDSEAFSQKDDQKDSPTDMPAGFTDTADGSMAQSGAGRAGKIGDVAVGTVETARFTTLNKDKTLSREFGFKTLLHDRGGEWEIEKPYMNIFKPNFKCYINADTGNVLLDADAQRPTPKDVTLTGNVVIHIVPHAGANVKESFVYLDDVTFISEKSRFSTAGPVRFVNEGAQMTGSGMELIYDAQLDRLEVLRIFDLHSLRIKALSKTASLFAAGSPDRSSAESPPQSAIRAPVEPSAAIGDQDGIKMPANPTAVDIRPPEKTAKLFVASSPGRSSAESPPQSAIRAPVEPSAAIGDQDDIKMPANPTAVDIRPPEPKPATGQQEVQQVEGYFYKCAFSENVVIDSPGQLIFADEVFINNIFWQKGSAGEANQAGSALKPPARPDKAQVPGPAAQETTDPVQSAPVTHPADTDDTQTSRTALAEQTKTDESDEQFVDITVTCNNGILVVPMDSSISLKDFPEPDTRFAPADNNNPGIVEAGRRRVFTARRIDYDAFAGNTFATGPSELVFYVADVAGGRATAVTVPVTVTARRKAEFLPASNLVLFEGDCLCTMVRDHLPIRQKYRLSAPKITVNLTADEDRQSATSAMAMEHLTAAGGVVQLDASRWADEKLLGFTKLKALQFDYDSRTQTFLATGPDGIIAVDNSRIAASEQTDDKFSLQRPCYAVVQGFDTLKYFLDQNRIIAGAASERIIIDYFPVVDGRYGQKVTGSAANVEAHFVQTDTGQSRLSTLTATGGVDYEDQDKQFAGSSLFYDADKSIMTVHGDDSQPCLLNGVLVPAVEYNLKTGRVTTRLSAPGAFQTKK